MLTCLAGIELYGVVKATILRGQTIYEDGEFAVNAPLGEWVLRDGCKVDPKFIDAPSLFTPFTGPSTRTLGDEALIELRKAIRSNVEDVNPIVDELAGLRELSLRDNHVALLDTNVKVNNVPDVTVIPQDSLLAQSADSVPSKEYTSYKS